MTDRATRNSAWGRGDYPVVAHAAFGCPHRASQVFYLPLSDPSKSVPSIRTEMQTIQADSAQLLFLRRVTEISLKGDWAAEEESEQFVDAWARIMVAGSQDPRAATTRQRFQQTGSEPPVLLEEITTRFQISSHEDVLVALPKVEEPPPQRVFAFLPVRSVTWPSINLPCFPVARSSAYSRA